jgi:hypothetical protein
MNIHGDKSKVMIMDLPIDGAGSNIVRGALVTPGVTAATDMGVFIVSGAAGADVIGYIDELHDFSADGDSTPEVATKSYVQHKVAFFLSTPILEAEYDLTDVITATGGSTTSVTATSLEDDIDGGWIYFVSGTAIGQLAYITAAASGTATLATITTAPVASDTFIKLVNPSKQAVKLTTTRDKIGSDAAAGSWTVAIIKHQFTHDGISGRWIDLDPLKHHNLQGLNNRNVKFRTLLVPSNTAYNRID